MKLLSTHVFKNEYEIQNQHHQIIEAILPLSNKIVIGGSLALCSIGVLNRTIHDVDFMVEKQFRTEIQSKIQSVAILIEFEIEVEAFKDHDRFKLGEEYFCVFYVDEINYIITTSFKNISENNTSLLHQIQLTEPSVIIDAKYNFIDEESGIPPHYDTEKEKHSNDIDKSIEALECFYNKLKLCML